jgi:adenosine deaminase
MRYKNLPKIELHLHLDCSLSYQVVKTLRPGTSQSDYKKLFVAPAKCFDLADYIKRASAAIELMQTSENLRLVVIDLFDQLQQENVIYAELRFAPLEHIHQGLSPEAVVDLVNHAVEARIQETGIEAGIILCTLRHYSAGMSMQTVKLVKEFKGTRVVGFDIASDEAGYPIDSHVGAFHYASLNGINCNAHAGEAKGAESMWETLEHFKPSRIGHGVRCAEDPRLVEYIRNKDIHLEVCPTSNVQTNVFPRFTDHNIEFLYRQGVSLSVNTDCRTISNVTLTSEYAQLKEIFGWDEKELFHCNIEAVKHAFTSEIVKARLLEKLKEGFL